MAHKGSFRGGCEIVEVQEDKSNKMGHEQNAHHSRLGLRTEEKDGRSLPSNFSDVSSLEDDLNQLFETFNRRHSSQGTGYSPHNGIGTSKRHASKKPMRASSASAHGISEKVNLKQAFRGLCISQASEMAAMKRSTKSGGSSEAGRIMTMYRNVVVDDNSSVVSQDEGIQGLLEVSLMPEQPATSGNEFGSSSSQNDGALGSHDSTNEVTSVKGLSRKKTPSGAVKTSRKATMKNANKLPPTEPEAVPSSAETSQGETETEFLSASSKCASLASLTELPQKDQRVPSPTASHSGDGSSSLEIGLPTAVQIVTVPSSSAFGAQTSNNAILRKEEHIHQVSSDLSDHDRNTQVPVKSGSEPHKLMSKERAVKSAKIVQKGTSAGLGKGNKAKKSTRSVSHLVKPVIKTKNFAKRRSKKDTSSARSPNVTHSEFNNALYPGPSNVVCPRCQCVLADEWEEVGEDLLFSPGPTTIAQLSPYSLVVSPSADLSPLTRGASPSVEQSLDNGFSDVGTPNNNLKSTRKPKEAVGKEGKSKSREKGEFTQSSKSSPEECSTSTSISEDTNLSRPSCCDRPHMSKDVRWQAIREFKAQHGAVSLRHFNLLKKLGCGDIGTVYLAELIDANCLFAIKVMDNEFLARRKKIMRAQTEREILRMLDHPFLPTLYCQFTSDNLSCLVMEYCPGGDLHVLRQKQPGRCFTEHAARFYLAEVLLALEYLHMLGVIYRDLKPENILVREDGHIMLSDFDLSLRCAVNPTLLVSSSATETTKSTSGPFKDSGCVQPFCIQQPSCQVSCFGPKMSRGPTKPRKQKPEPSDPPRPLPLLVAEPTSARSNSFVGTHEYLAPEIIKGEGHGAAVDWWTFGIFLYELLYGRTPFRGIGNEETLANVVLQSLKFPDSPLVSLQARDLINRLLVKEPEGRLGSERGAAEIKRHPFFEGLNWALIRCAVPPELPEFHRSYGAAKGSFHENNNGSSSGYLEYNASTGEHLEFEVF